jgi:hypothetical protein
MKRVISHKENGEKKRVQNWVVCRAGLEDFGAWGGRKFGTLYIYKNFMRPANTLR